MPDLKITVNWNNTGKMPRDERSPVCQWMRPDDHTLVCLLDRLPEELATYNEEHPDKSGIILSQPPHQQRFSFGNAYLPDKKKFEFKLRHLYTENPPDGEWPLWQRPDSTSPQPEEVAAAQIDPESRVLKSSGLAKAVNQGIRQQLGGDTKHPTAAYLDFVPNSAELGLELNDPAYYFAIYAEAKECSSNTEQILRQVWTPGVKFGPPDKKPDTLPPTFSGPIFDPLKPLKQPSPPDDGKAVVNIPVDVPGNGSKIIPVDKPTDPTDSDKGHIPQNMLPIKSFQLDVFAAYKGLHPRIPPGVYDPDDYIPTNSKYLIDIVFSIRKGANRNRNDQQLREIRVRIPTVPDSHELTKTDALLAPDWAGSVRMLGNQRFIPFLNRSDTYLDVRLVPRSAQVDPVISLDDNRTAEVSFKLTDVAVPATQVTKGFTFKNVRKNLDFGFARIDMWETYQLDKQGLMVKSVIDVTKKYFVIKKEVDE
ncbi:hypothetical protein E8E13_000446 [Curvularia kusanoi]|uniref:Uncharacterized protein n=1 Tax=Curvularia kusanoi TaxID=90978 RepID=A0A9P4T3X9_CURKU|nr:hypothetical protein E8E13_000446 [Curvularia kusanoi]